MEAFTLQTKAPYKIIIVDNSSTDGTINMLTEKGWLNCASIEILALKDNTGGAGGFSAGLDYAVQQGAEWIWMMDDDAEPHPTALEELIKIAKDTSNIYGSLAVNGEYTSWLMTLLGSPNIKTKQKKDIPYEAEVNMLPFLGFLIHRNLVSNIGLPDAGFFIAADDVEYCLRARTSGAKIIIAGNSHIEHPASFPYHFYLPGYTLTCLKIPPWKRYYDTRNRLLIAKKHYGIKLYTQTIPASFIRMLATLIHEPEKVLQLKAFCAGMVDGLLGIKGQRHNWWKIG